MGKRESFQDLPRTLPKAGEELWRWLHGQLRSAILDGRLRSGARVPSSRDLARQYNVSRGTVVAAFNHLKREGYIEMQVGAGAFVATNIPDNSVAVTRRPADTSKYRSRTALSIRGHTSVENIVLLSPSHSVGRAFRP